MYPSVSLDNFRLDESLARRLPRQLAYYHLALPIGVDEEGITVAMSQPDNTKAGEIIQKALGQPIILVQSDAEQIRRLLDAIWPVERLAPWQRIVTSGDDRVVDYYARQFANFYGSQIVDAPVGSPENTLFIQRFSESLTLHRFSSTLLVNRVVQPIFRILHLVRLHTPDHLVISSLLPLMKAESSQMTLLPDTSVVAFNLGYLLDNSNPQGQHLEKLEQQLNEAAIAGLLCLRQTKFVQAVQIELAERDYDLVAVAADAYGEIVQTLVAAIEPYNVPAMMIIKPDLR